MKVTNEIILTNIKFNEMLDADELIELMESGEKVYLYKEIKSVFKATKFDTISPDSDVLLSFIGFN